MQTQPTYTIKFQSGVTIQTYGTLRAAKVQATKALAHGCGSVAILDVEGTERAQYDCVVAQRNFWSSGNRFGWGQWE